MPGHEFKAKDKISGRVVTCRVTPAGRIRVVETGRLHTDVSFAANYSGLRESN
jgi:hypothetical protein